MWVKICGLTDVENARDVARLGPDAVGLNFYEGSPRVVDADQAARIVNAVGPGVQAVGVFVNHRVEEIRETCGHSGIGTVQLHGDEPPTMLAELSRAEPGFRIIRAFRAGPEGLDEIAEYLAECRTLEARLDACLIDARVKGLYGGSGRTAPWDRIRAEYRFERWPPLILAGGLDPRNVAQAAKTVEPWGVDVSSGVESAPGIKDIPRAREFLSAAR
jgi:phosphoribosylanthranilate isomerase